VRRQAGFTLLELLVTLVLVGFGLALAAQLLMETSQMMADAAAEQTESALPLARARLRADLQSCVEAQAVAGPNGRIAELRLAGHPAGTVRYRKVGRDLLRDVTADGTTWSGQTVVLRNVQSWDLLPLPPGVVGLEIHTLRRAARHSPLPALPGTRGPADEERVETLVAVPRGGGMGAGW
jgi:prepilin-type N-terminal cleavage/methylation domain-containing protein